MPILRITTQRATPGAATWMRPKRSIFPPVVAAIRETGYDGFLCQEFVPTGDPIQALKQAFEVCS